MELSISTEKLKKAVSCTSRAASGKVIQPILNNLMLSCEIGSLLIHGTDLDVLIECKVPANVSKTGKISLPAKKLDEIIGKIPGDDVKIQIDKNLLAKISSNKSRFQVNGVSAEDFPDIDTDSTQALKFFIKSEELYKAISLTSFATSKFESSSVLSGVNLSISNEKFELAATDGSRLSRFVGNLSKSPSSEIKSQSIVIPYRAITELERLITSFKEGNEDVEISLRPGQIMFRSSDFLISTRLINGLFPDYERLIPKSQSKKIIVLKSLLLGALERVAVLSNERTSVVKISISKGAGEMVLSANSQDFGNANDQIDIDYSGDDIEIAFNYKYLTEALRNLDVEKVVLELETSLSPLIMKAADKEKTNYSYTYLVMPVQIR